LWEYCFNITRISNILPENDTLFASLCQYYTAISQK
jgi:hypothetical protein